MPTASSCSIAAPHDPMRSGKPTDTPLDLWVVDERGRPARPWFTVILDDYSRAVGATHSVFTRPRAFRRRWRYARRSGGRVIRIARCAAAPRPSTAITAATSPRITWSKSPPSSSWRESTLTRVVMPEARGAGGLWVAFAPSPSSLLRTLPHSAPPSTHRPPPSSASFGRSACGPRARAQHVEQLLFAWR
jgi:hypothetical protein